ncbi:MAG: Flp family type IVb pilin [Sphingobium sp.]
MRGLKAYLARLALWRCERGATAIEYGLILSLVVLAILATLSSFASKTTGMWNNVAAEVIAH